MDTIHVSSSNLEKKGLICPWQIVPLMDNLLRPLVHNPRKLFAPYVGEGMTVLDVGCGAGFASLGLAELVGAEGSVIAADLQPQMLGIVKKRAMRAGLSARIRTHLCGPNRIGVRENLDFAVAFFMVHEVPDARNFIEEIFTLLREGGKFFLIEPKIHVKSRDFQKLVREAQAVGFKIVGRPGVRFGYTVLLMKSE